MNEEKELYRVVRAALESRGAFAAPRFVESRIVASRRRAWSWGGATLLAASLTLAVMFEAHLDSARADSVGEAIALMAEVDGVELEAGASAVELLAAWQEAPCAEIDFCLTSAHLSR